MRSVNLPSRRLVSQEDSAIIAAPHVPRSRFMNTWNALKTFDAGYLIPFLLDEVLPGDHMTYNVTAYVRMATPLFPLFSNQRIDTHFFFVPNRIVWDSWERFMGQQNHPAESIALTIPIIVSAAGGYQHNTIYDHYALPLFGQIAGGETYLHSALPLRGYNRIYTDWFKDQNNVASPPALATDNGPDLYTAYDTLKRAKSHDYFTGALPWAQKFTPPTIPLGTQAPISGIGITGLGGGSTANVKQTAPLGTVTYTNSLLSSDPNVVFRVTAADASAVPDIYADLSVATGVAINTLRQAFLVQQLLERDARGGTRYVEIIKSHFGVTSPDFRLNRSEYIGGGQSPLNVTAIAQTAPTDDLPVGALGAAATATGQHRATYAATEHGYIHGFISVKSELAYQQGLARHWSRSTRYDFYLPSLAGLGEQAILRQEIYCTGVDANDSLVFGYQERWHEYRTRYSEVTGYFRSTDATPIDQWHLAQEFSSAPTLNQTFIEDTPPMSRVLAAGAEALGQQYLADIMIHRTAVRPIPTFGTPVTLGRF